MRLSRLLYRIAENAPGKRFNFLQGGTSSTKTFSVLQWFYLLAKRLRKPETFSVVSESVPHLRRGALRDWMAILGQDYNPDTHNKTEETFKIRNCMIEFFAVDHPEKARGGRRDRLYINEMNRIPKTMYDQLEPRTRRQVFADWNPTARFYGHDIVENPKNKDILWFDKSNYHDAFDNFGVHLLDDGIVRSIEGRKETDKNWWRVYGLGEIGQLEGLIIPEFELVDELPADLDTDCGLDFGYSNDPSVLLESGVQGGYLWINQLFYSTGMTNPDICKEMDRIGVPRDYIIYGDSAEPKSIKEIFNEGFHGIKPCLKGKDCFRLGIDHLHRYKIKVTKRSVDIIKDFRNAMWEQDINGKFGSKAKKGYLHSIDAAIYSMTGRIKPPARVRGGHR